MVSQSDLLPMRHSNERFWVFGVSFRGHLVFGTHASGVLALTTCIAVREQHAWTGARVPSLLTLIQRVPSLAVKVAKIFSLNEIEAGAFHAAQQFNNLLMRNRRALVGRHEATAPLI